MRKTKKTFFYFLALLVSMASVSLVSAKSIYVSSSGNDSNSGSSSAQALKTLNAAYALLTGDDEITVLDSVSYTEPSAHSGNLVIKGSTSNVKLTLPTTVSLKGPLKLDNIALSGSSTVYANGFSFEVSSAVTSDSTLTVYGGKNASALTGNTDIKLFGGQYIRVYGGGNGGAVNGNTNVVLGGNANYTTTPSSDVYIYGGGNNAKVTGTANITLQDNAVCTYLFGAGTSTNGTAAQTNVYVKGGKAMNIFGGSNSSTAANNGAVYNTTITGGKVEAIFGGNFNSQVNGHTYVNLFGGEVTRRVYTGCYNDTSGTFTISFSTDYYVNGTTVLTIAPGVFVNTKSGLSFTDQFNVGVFSGSRTKAQHDAEQNTIIYLDNCYSTYSSKIGEKSVYTSAFKSFADYVVQVGTGGDVVGTSTAGQVYIAPDKGNYGAIGSAVYYNENAAVSANTTVTFADAFNINSVSASIEDGNIAATVDVTAVNAEKVSGPLLYVAVYDGTKLLKCSIKDATASNSAQKFTLPFVAETGKSYTVKAMLWDGRCNPLAETAVTAVN